MAAFSRIGVLASGGGSNLQALIDADLGAPLALVIVNEPGAYARQRAEAAGITTALIDHRTFDGRAAFDETLVAALQSYDIDLVVLAGFMRIIGAPMLEAFGGRILNIHPALLPAFPGIGAQKKALEAGVKIAGCTVHVVDAGVDTGPILAQAALTVRAGEDAKALSKRILALEHRLLPAVVAATVAGRLGPSGLEGSLDLRIEGALIGP